MSKRSLFVVFLLGLAPSCVLDRAGLGSDGAGGSMQSAGGQTTTASSSPASAGGGGIGGRPGAGGSPSVGGSGGQPTTCDSGCIDLAGGVAVLQQKKVCPPGWSPSASRFVAVDPGCETCSCGAPQGGNCSVSNISTHGGKACGNGNTVVVPLLSSGTCQTLTNGPDSYTTGPSVASDGSCKASMSQPRALQKLTLCAPIEALQTCGSGKVCQPDIEERLCTLVPASMLCPPELPVSTLLAEGFSDSRSCACSCGPSKGLLCGKTGVDVYDSTDCSGTAAGTVLANTQNCTTIEGEGDQSIKVRQSTWSGQPCIANSQHSGTVAFSNQERLCCSD